MANSEIRVAAVSANVKLWQVAEVLGIADCSLSRKLRRELPETEKQHILDIIYELSGEVMQ